MANTVYRRIFDDVFVMTSAEKSIRRDVFALYSGENTSDVLLWNLLTDHRLIFGKHILFLGTKLVRFCSCSWRTREYFLDFSAPLRSA